MPNFDAGHYFLTLLVPVRAGSILKDGQTQSHRHLIREILANMPSAESTVASQGRGGNSPFARDTRTHFARFVVLDDVVFNGRVSGNTLLDKARRVNPLVPGPVDQLSTPFLILAIDFDADSGADDDLKNYLLGLWATMSEELAAVLQHCVGFDRVTTGDEFFHYVKRCQIETTLPFNDYWTTPPALKDFNFWPYGISAAIAALAFIYGLFSGPAWLSLTALLALALIISIAYRKIKDRAQTPFPLSPPPAPGSDLPTVLKALQLQRAFTNFVIDAQGQNDQGLYDTFGSFIANQKPHDTTVATQKPGIIGV